MNTVQKPPCPSEIEAGKPYIIKWNAAAQDLVTPEFTGVTINSATNNVETTYADFVGTYSPVTFAKENKSILFLGADDEGSKLYYPQAGTSIGAFRAYIELKGITAGTPTTTVKEFKLIFEDEDATGPSTIENEQLTIENAEYYDLQGRKLNSLPSGRSGGGHIYIIRNSDGTSRKVLVK